MTKPVRLVADAEADIAEAIDWYEHERPGLGREFLDEVRAAIRTLGRPGPECRPVIGLPTELGVRRKLLRRFPYLVVFIELPAVVQVLAVPHARRRPAFWRDRLRR